MFSKPILIAISVESARAAIMKVTTTAITTGTHFSDATGCGKCLSLVNGKWYSGGASSLWAEEASPGTISVAGSVLTGDICCGSASTTETGGASTLCGGAWTNTSTNTVASLGANDYFQAALAQCPHNTTNCTAAGLLSDTITAISFSEQRYLNLDVLGSYVTLSLIHQTTATVGSVNKAFTQRDGDVCTWVVYGKCDAPVLTIPSTSQALDGTTPEFEIQVTEWSDEFVNAADDNTWEASNQSGASGKLYYPPLGTSLTAIITDLQASEVATTTPNNMYGDVKFKNPITTGTTYQVMSGNLLLDWITNIKAVYSAYDSAVTTYNTNAATWKTYTEYTAPTPGLFDGIVGAAEDPNKPATAYKPLQPTQPVAVPAKIASLELSKTDVVNPVLYTGLAGYGHPSTYMIKPIPSNSGKPWGTLAGKAQNPAAATAWDTKTDGTYSIRKTSNKDSATTNGYKANCDKSYLMITGWLKVTGATLQKIVQLRVTASEFSTTLEENLPTRPSATTAPVSAPAGASHLAVSTVAAALTALYLF